jgi:hypothetical protein
MPESFPQVGEFWRNNISQTDAIVAKVEGTLVTFVSFTGVRAPIQFNNKASCQGIWEFRDSARGCVCKCSRKGCERPAFIQYERPLAKFPEIVCPLHIPKGIKSSFPTMDRCLHPEIFPTASFESQICKQCNEDATEVLCELPLEFRGTLWNCQKCGKWWIHVIFNVKEYATIAYPTQYLRNLCPSGYEFYSIDADPSKVNMLSYNIYVKPRGIILKGPQPLTLYDYLRLDEDF